MSGFRAVLDACVLVPMVKADVLLEFAHLGAFHPLWSARIIDEVAAAIPRATRGRVSLEQAGRRLARMNAAFEDAEVGNWRELEGHMVGIPDPNDRHVVAAAVSGHASAIVTDNLKDFPEPPLGDWGLHAVDSDTFLMDLFDLSPERGNSCLEVVAARRRRPPQSVADLLEELARGGAPQFARLVGADRGVSRPTWR